jgi:hypothetical protein
MPEPQKDPFPGRFHPTHDKLQLDKLPDMSERSAKKRITWLLVLTGRAAGRWWIATHQKMCGCSSGELVVQSRTNTNC